MAETAVDWLFTTLDNMLELYPSEWEKVSKAVEQAKAMEQQQITFAYNDGADAMVAGKYKSMEDYYNDMYQSRQDKTDK